MKKLILTCLILCLLVSGCTTSKKKEQNVQESDGQKEVVYTGLDDSTLVEDLETEVYDELINNFKDKNYYISDIEVKYISDEYLEELSYNSNESIYFGYSLSELDKKFGDTKYIFDIDENGKTVVKELKECKEEYNKTLKNLAIGSGIILIGGTISLGLASVAPQLSFVVAVATKESAKLSTIGAVSTGVISTAASMYETKNFNQALSTGIESASEGFKVGALTGLLSGASKGVTFAKQASVATKNGLTFKEAYKIQKQSKYPNSIISRMHSMDEYKVFQNAKLKPMKINGKDSLVREIDLDFIGESEAGITNLERMKRGLAPLDKNGNSYQLHHIGQKQDSPLAILTDKEHNDNSKILNIKKIGESSEIDRAKFVTEKKKFWKELAEVLK